MRKPLPLTLLILWMGVGVGRTEPVPQFQLSFEPDRHVDARTMRQYEWIDIYIRNVGPDFEYGFIAFDLEMSELTEIVVTGAWAEPYFTGNCDFPPWNWCIVSPTCRRGADTPIIGGFQLVAYKDVAEEFVVCPLESAFWSPFPDREAGYLDCDDNPYPLVFVGHPDNEPSSNCVRILPSRVARGSRSWSALKTLW